MNSAIEEHKRVHLSSPAVSTGSGSFWYSGEEPLDFSCTVRPAGRARIAPVGPRGISANSGLGRISPCFTKEYDTPFGLGSHQDNGKSPFILRIVRLSKSPSGETSRRPSPRPDP